MICSCGQEMRKYLKQRNNAETAVQKHLTLNDRTLGISKYKNNKMLYGSVPFQSNDRPEAKAGNSSTADDNITDWVKITFFYLHHYSNQSTELDDVGDKKVQVVGDRNTIQSDLQETSVRIYMDAKLHGIFKSIMILWTDWSVTINSVIETFLESLL